MSGPIPCSVPRANTAKGNAGTEENKQQKKRVKDGQILMRWQARTSVKEEFLQI